MRKLTIAALVVGFMIAVGMAAETRPFNVRDLVGLDRIGDPQVSPDGETIVFVVRSTDLEADRGRRSLWSVGVDGTLRLAQLTHGDSNDLSPRFSPDGEGIYFLSNRSESYQVWRLPTAGST